MISLKHLTSKLKNNGGIDGYFSHLRKSFRHNRRQRVILSGQTSNCKFARPLFFLIYFNNLPEGLKSDAEHFANNASLFSVIKCVKISALIINNDLLKLQC